MATTDVSRETSAETKGGSTDRPTKNNSPFSQTISDEATAIGAIPHQTVFHEAVFHVKHRLVAEVEAAIRCPWLKGVSA